MSRDAVSEEVDHQNSAGDKQHSSFGVNIIAVSALDVAGDRPGQVGHTLYSQLLCQILLRRERKKGFPETHLWYETRDSSTNEMY